MKKILFILLALVLALSVGIIGCTTPAQQEEEEEEPPIEEWYLPLMVPLTGAMAWPGLQAEWSANYAAGVVNDAGGAGGIPIKIVSYDAPGDPAVTVTAQAEIIELNPLYQMGPMHVVVMGAVIQMIADEAIPLTGYFASNEQRMQYAPLFTQMMPDDLRCAKAGAIEWITMHPEIESVAIFYYTGLTEPTAVAAVEALTEAGVTVHMMDINIGVDIDMGPIVTRAMAENVDGYYCVTYGLDYVNILKALSDRGMNDGWRTMSAGSVLGPEVFDAGQLYNEDVYIWEPFDLINIENPEFQAYVASYRADHDGGFPYTWANYGFYLAVKAFAAAVEAENITGDPAKLAEERVKIRDFFWNAEAIPGFGSDMFSYNDDGYLNYPLHIYQVKLNQLTLVKTIDFE